MKASLKFRDDQKPLFRAKVPLSILGLPFQSGIVAGESKELSLNLSTFFESGPSIKIAYRPNDTWNPFSLIVKTGMGPFGSPSSSSMLMSAEFNLVGPGCNPAFMLHFKPRFGDFSIKKSQSSTNMIGSHLLDQSSIEVVDSPVKKISVLPPSAARAIAGAVSGVEVAATTKLPVRCRAVVNFRWGVRVPEVIKSGDSINFRKIPFLVMNKVGIEHVDGHDSKSKLEAKGVVSSSSEMSSASMAEVCLAVKKQLEVLQAENGMLKRAVEDLKQEIATTGKVSLPRADSNSAKYNREVERNGTKILNKKSMETDVNEELKKALKGNVSVGA